MSGIAKEVQFLFLNVLTALQNPLMTLIKCTPPQLHRLPHTTATQIGINANPHKQ